MLKIAFVLDLHLTDTPPRSRKDDYLENTLWELGKIYEENDTVVLLGDVLHRPTLTTRAEDRIIGFFQRHLEQGKKSYTIVGNHDIYNMTLESFKDSKLCIFDRVGVLPVIWDTLQLEGLTIDVIPLSRKAVIPTAKNDNSILLGHLFFESSADPKFSIKRDDLMGRGYKYVILGHDHEEYQPVLIPEADSSKTTTVLRPGALARHTAHKYNLERDLAYIQVQVTAQGIVSVERKLTPTIPAREVFREEEFLKLEGPSKSASSMNFVHNITEMLNAFSLVSNKDGAMSLVKALETVGTPSLVVTYLKIKHEELGKAFN